VTLTVLQFFPYKKQSILTLKAW